MTRTQIIDLVIAKMDEVHPFAQGETIHDVQIGKQLDNAAVSLIEMLPSVLAHPVSAEGPFTISNHKSGARLDIECPGDFVRLHRVTLSDWERPVIELMPDGIKLLYEQDYEMIRATIRRPKAALYTKDSTDYITCYPAPVIEPPEEPPAVPEYVTEFVYVQRPTAAESLDDSLIDMLAWKAAGLIYTISRQSELANTCYTMLNQMIETKLKYRG